MIRQLKRGDAAIFRKIRLESLRTEPEAFASELQDWENLPAAEWDRRLTANPVFVCFDDGDPVGIMGLLRQTPSKMAHRATLIMVFVRPSHRGRGRAEELLRAVTEHAENNGIRQLELAVSAENPAAIRFYERMGYRQIGCVPAGFLHAGRAVDELLLVRRLGA